MLLCPLGPTMFHYTLRKAQGFAAIEADAVQEAGHNRVSPLEHQFWSPCASRCASTRRYRWLRLYLQLYTESSPK